MELTQPASHAWGPYHTPATATNPCDAYTAKISLQKTTQYSSSRAAHSPTAFLLRGLLRDGFYLPCLKGEDGANQCLSPLLICMRIQGNELYLNFCTCIRFD